MAHLTANQLAKYMVSTETGKIGIIKQAKSDNKAGAIRYKNAREAIKAHLTDIKRSREPLEAAYNQMEQAKNDSSLSPFARNDASASLDALDAFDVISNQLGGYEFAAAPKRQPKLILSGVKINITLDLLVKTKRKGIEHIGGALFRFTQADGESEAAASQRRNMNAYAATLAHMQVTQSFAKSGNPLHEICYAVDVQFKEVIAAPKTYARRASDMENACRFVSAIWDDV